jgi:hypothetical protein
MADERDWSKIGSGSAFEGLVTTIIYFEDPTASLFGRAGADGGQDARSGDGTLVYQMKHHVAATPSKAISDAKAEATKIKEYRYPAHGRYAEWAAVQKWRLVTNASFNPADQQRWDTEVVPAFKALGLDASLWELATLEALLAKHPEVDRAFFGGENRVFLTLPEVRGRPSFEPEFIARGAAAAFEGRAGEIAKVLEFANGTQAFLVVHGPGGIGKTRLLLEAGELLCRSVWQVLWANTSTMESSGSWYEGIVPGRKTLVIVDEPESEQVLRQLVEQVGSAGGALDWKIAVSVRTPKDPVLRFMSGPKVKKQVQHLAIGPLPRDASIAMCTTLLSNGSLSSASPDALTRVAAELAKRFSDHPVWLALAVHVLEQAGDLGGVPDTAEDLADLYLTEIVESQEELDHDKLLELLRWIALLGTANIEDESTLTTMAAAADFGTATAVRAAIARLAKRRALAARGARSRLVELKPDVLRDHLLRRWLTLDVGIDHPEIVPSDAASNLTEGVANGVKSGRLTRQGQAVLVALARTEAVLAHSSAPVDILSKFLHALGEGLPEMTASARILLAETLTTVAELRPSEVVNLSRTIRSAAAPTEVIKTYFGERQVTQDEVVLELAWPVFHAAMGARAPECRAEVLRELVTLVELEAEIGSRRPRGLPNDGKRAGQLVGRVLEGGPDFWAPFDDAAEQLCLELLGSIRDHEAAPARITLLKALLQPATAVERHEIRSEGHSIQIHNYIILPGHPAWLVRDRVLNEIRWLLQREDTPPRNRAVLWEVLADAHSSLGRASSNIPEGQANPLLDQSMDDLWWAYSTLSARGAPLAELTAARMLWDWHRRFDTGSAKDIAERLEQLYAANDLAAEFAPLTSHDDWEGRGPRALAKAEQLAAGGDAAIHKFVERAVWFLGTADRIQDVQHVAHELGRTAAPGGPAISYSVNVLRSDTGPAHHAFAAVVLSRHAWAMRTTDATKVSQTVAGWVDACASDALRILVLRRMYGFVPVPNWAREPTPAEVSQLYGFMDLFLNSGSGAAFLEAIGWTFRFDWERWKALAEAALGRLPADQVGWATHALVESVYWGTRDTPDPLPSDMGRWVLDRLLAASDLGMLGHHLAEIMKRTAAPDVAWFVRSVQRGADFEALAPAGRGPGLSKFVRPIAPTDSGDPSAVEAVAALVGFAIGEGKVAYRLPRIIANLDPLGVLAPASVAQGLADRLGDVDALWRLARIAGGYPQNGGPWRRIARAVVPLAIGLPDQERWSLFRALLDSGAMTYSANIGEVPQVFIDRARAARESRDAESDDALMPFWKWLVEVTEADLVHEVERAKEDRGE